MGHTSPVITISNFRGYYDDGAEGAATPTGTAGTNWTQSPDVNYRCRLVCQETAGGSSNNTTYQWQYNYNGGGWNNITTTSSVVRAFTTTYFTDDGDTTSQIGGSGTFVTPNEGFSEDGANAGAAPDMAGSDYFETELCFQIRSADTTAGLTLQLRCQFNGAAPGGTPTLPTITVGANRAVTQNPAQGGDLTTCSFTESAATVTKTILRRVTGTTVVLTQGFGGFGTTAVTTHYLDGHTYAAGTAWNNITNCFDGNENTYGDGEVGVAGGRGVDNTCPAGTGPSIVRMEGRWLQYINEDPGYSNTTWDRLELGYENTSGGMSYGQGYGFPTNSSLPLEGTENKTWTSWYDANAINLNPSGTPSVGYDLEPHPRTGTYNVYNHFGTIFVAGISERGYMHKIEVRCTTGVYNWGKYGVTSVSDPDGAWTNDANAADGSDTTYAYTTTPSASSSWNGSETNELVLTGGDVASFSGEIYNVNVRLLYEQNIVTNSSFNFSVFDSDATTPLSGPYGFQNAGQSVGADTSTSGKIYGPWVTCRAPAGGWSLSAINGLVVKVMKDSGSDSTTEVRIYGVEVAVGHEDFNPQGATVTKTIGRVASGTTAALAFVDNNATVPIDRSINSLSYSEKLKLTTNDATIARPNRRITGKTAKPKQWKALEGSIWWVDGHTGIYGSHDAGTIGNALDKNLVTKYDPVSYQFPFIQGTENLAPQSSPTALPAGIKVRMYLSGTPGAYTALVGGWHPGDRAEYIGNTFDGYKVLGTMTITGSGSGAWTEWYECQLPYNVSGRSSGSHPFSWNDIQEYFTVDIGSVFIGNIYVHGIQILVEEAEPANFISGYVDASHGWEDDKGGWTNKASAWDGNEATFASTIRGSTTTWVDTYLTAAGNTLTQGAAQDEVRAVWMRAKLRGQYSGANNLLTCILYPYHPDYYDWSGDSKKFPVVERSLSGYNTQYFAAPDDPENIAMWDFAATNTAFWTPWYRLEFDSLDPDWAGTRNWKSWEEVQRMGFRLYRGTDPDRTSTLEISKVEYLVLAEPPNTSRKGGKAKIDRGVNSSTELVEWDGTSYPATVSTASVNRNVTCTTEAISMTESASTVNRERGVVSTTEAISAASTGSVARVRVVAGATQALQMAEGAATINASRVTLGITEALSSTSAGTNVDTARGVAGATQALAFTEQQSTVNVARGVISGTESVTISENQSSLNRERGVNAGTEAVVMTESAATISTTSNLDVTCTTEAIAFTETPASVNGTRIAAGTVEITAFVENASTVNAERIVSATTETLALTDNNATVSFGRIVAATTEVVSLAENTATANRQRGVNAGTEALSLTESPASANMARVAQCATEALTLADNNAIVDRQRGVNAGTEALALTESASTVDRQRGVNAGTEAVVMTESLSTVLRGANLDVACTTEAITFAENTAAIAADRAVNGVTETVTFGESAADIARNRSFVASSEVLAFTEAAASVVTDRGVAASTELLALTEAAATVARDRVFTASTESLNLSENAATIDITANNLVVTCATEALSFAESAATVAFPRVVIGVTESVTLTETVAGVNGWRIVGATVELAALVENAALVNLSRTVISQTDQLVVAESAANVSTTTSRIVTGITEQLSVLSSASVASSRHVSSSTEIISLLENPSSIQIERQVVCASEQLSLAESAASPNLTREAVATTAALTLLESAGQVFRGANLDVTAITAAIAFTESAASITFPRTVSGVTQVLDFVANAASANLPKLIAAATAPITMAERQATITKLPANIQPGSMVWVDPGTEGFIFVGNTVIQRYD